MISLIVASVASSLILATMSLSSPHVSFNAVNQIQLLLLLLLLHVHFPKSVVNYIRSLSSALIDFKISMQLIPEENQLVTTFEHDQPNDDLYIIGLESGSAIINIADPLLSFFILVLITLAVLP